MHDVNTKCVGTVKANHKLTFKGHNTSQTKLCSTLLSYAVETSVIKFRQMPSPLQVVSVADNNLSNRLKTAAGVFHLPWTVHGEGNYIKDSCSRIALSSST